MKSINFISSLLCSSTMQVSYLQHQGTFRGQGQSMYPDQSMHPSGAFYGQPMHPSGAFYGQPMHPSGAFYGQPMHPPGAFYGQGQPIQPPGAVYSQGQPIHPLGAFYGQGQPIHPPGAVNGQGQPMHPPTGHPLLVAPPSIHRSEFLAIPQRMASLFSDRNGTVNNDERVENTNGYSFDQGVD